MSENRQAASTLAGPGKEGAGKQPKEGRTRGARRWVRFLLLRQGVELRETGTTNLWALKKSPRLKAVLVLQAEQLGPDGVVVDQRTATVDEGIWLRHPSDPSVRAYVYVHGQEDGKAGVHLEYPVVLGTPPVLEFSENVEPSALAELLAAHFDISQVRPLPGSSRHHRGDRDTDRAQGRM